MKSMIAKRGLSDKFLVASAAASSEELGSPVYPPVRRILAKRGIFCDDKRAVKIKPQDYEKYDYIVCMDERNRASLRRIFSADPERKISSLMDYTANPHDVADPWYTGDFSKTEQDIDSGCLAFLNFLCGND